MKAAASAVLDRRLRDAIGDPARQGRLLEEIKPLLERGKAWGYQVEDLQALCRLLEKELQSALSQIVGQGDFPEQANRVNETLDTAALLGCRLDLWQAQNELLRGYAVAADAGAVSPETCKSFAHLAERLNVSSTLLGWRP
jgi:hypothetical protein